MANLLAWLTGKEDQTGQPPPFAMNDGRPSLRAYNPTPSERVGNWIQDLLMSGGAQAYPAGHVAHGVRDLLSISPLGIGMSAADLLHAKSAGDPMGAAAAAIGMVPGLKPEVQAVRQGIRAYHGSPHDFDRFDIKKIGTGEGAQAYGHGLYFAENEGVARAYRDQLAPGPAVGQQRFNPNDPRHLAAQEIHITGHIDDAQVNLEKKMAGFNDKNDPFGAERGKIKQAIFELDNIARAGTPAYEPGAAGKMYEVNINAKPEQFLDWDRKLAEHTPDVKKALVDLGYEGKTAENLTGKQVYYKLG